jgi:ribosomal protein L37AE/L43A
MEMPKSLEKMFMEMLTGEPEETRDIKTLVSASKTCVKCGKEFRFAPNKVGIKLWYCSKCIVDAMEEPTAYDNISNQLKIAKQRNAILEDAIYEMVVKGHIKDDELIHYLEFILDKGSIKSNARKGR